MNREEFEEWLENHKDEAIENCNQADAPVEKWIVRLAASLRSLAAADEGEEEEDDLPFDDDDDEEEEEEEAPESEES